MRKIVILGSTGSIGINTLKVISRYPNRFKVVALTACSNWELLANQVKVFKPQYAAINPEHISSLRSAVGPKVKILNAQTDLSFLAALGQVDTVVIAMSGRAALEPFLSAAKAGKQIAPANKEALVIAGEMIMSAAAKSGATVIPVDSEQSAIFQCLQGQNKAELAKIYLTASGGALYNVPAAQFDQVTVGDILNHPRWKMGKKITVDSATLMNKGFEVIEAQRLFSVKVNQIEVVVHPQAIIHSMVCYRDGSVLAQLGLTDMRLPIQYALTYPERWESGLENLDFAKLGQLTFAKPDLKKFPCLGLALAVAKEAGTLPTVLNAADEEAVDAFLKGQIRFTQIFKVVDKTVTAHQKINKLSLKVIQETDRWARCQARDVIKAVASKN
jgi:1-deoxy-D-xylulose-5-phosphate reductoisomerase